ncbi:ssl1498 family light-harvesting-like protein [Crocosphaera sp. UHCC 0190]|uniref:photosystem II assembly protein Psb34 n=1 Tax=Crocosphaera sp. UHCC 0190 TaxID=3110246 RepID=UPI002B1EB965|nr:ssl1498 family light-harvesting-like protein [Crocosphaera sp. UHCC 0190]MEA5510625.1 ssl1498 family light-harvesting-like protein [Crocosphaera sp. UHCC 0190]
MPYTTEEGGRLNNFAAEPKVYEAAPPTKSQQRNYIIMGVAALLLIGGLLTVAVYASSNVGVS